MNNKNPNQKNISKYMPSKKFTTIILVVVAIVVVVLIVFLLFYKKSNYSNQNTSLSIENQTVAELIENDTDRDSIADWEEALWGTDKNKKETFGVPDLEYIQSRKDELKLEQEQNDKALTETDKFARQFFAAYAAMKSSGAGNEEIINNFSNSLGQELASPILVDLYNASDVRKTANEDTDMMELYAENMLVLLEKYQAMGMGDELDIVSEGLNAYSNEGKESNYEELDVIGKAYQDFARDALKTTVPESLAETHLKIVNTANNAGISVLNMTKIINDPLIGLSGVTQYQKYSQEFVDAVNELENTLLKYIGE